jgi:hypothetical protein
MNERIGKRTNCLFGASQVASMKGLKALFVRQNRNLDSVIENINKITWPDLCVAVQTDRASTELALSICGALHTRRLFGSA